MCVSGAVGAKHSKILGEGIFDLMNYERSKKQGSAESPQFLDSHKFLIVPEDAEEFDHMAPTKFVGGAVATDVADMIKMNTKTVEARCGELTEAMTLHPTWVGALSKTEWDYGEWDSDMFNPILKKDDGACPFISINKLSCWRWGPAAVPLPGVASLVVALHPSATTFIQIFPAQHILSQGISLKDALAFLQTPEGGKMFTNDCKLVKLTAGEVLFVPFGMCASPIYLEPGADTKHKQKMLPSQVPLMFIPLFNVEWAKELSEPVWKAIVSLNTEHFVKTGTQAVFVARKAVFEKFVKARES
jgi:hypothetical protein